MNIQGLALELRPRPTAEAADLGIRLVQANAGSVWRIFTPVWFIVCALAFSLFEVSSWLPGLVIFWLKPWLDRSLLLVFSRAAFGETTHWSDLWTAQRQVWWSAPMQTLLWQRLSPWRAVVLPVMQLELQAGRELHARCAQILGGRRGEASWIQVVYAHAEMVLSAGVFALIAWMLPEGVSGTLVSWRGTDGSASVSVLASLVYPLAVLALEPFYVASGFAVYLNRRVQLEAWDVEQEFRRAYAP